MKLTRRDFLKTTAAGAGLALLPAAAWADFTHLRARKPLKILILGGTAFLGPAIVKYARTRGHQLTLFNRGRTNRQLFPDLEKLIGDRDGQLDALVDRDWDVVIDTSGYIPRMVADSAELLRDHCRQYIFISSISVYADFSVRGIDEDSPVGNITPEQIAAAATMRDITGENYGPLKALCEQEVRSRFGRHACNIRPGLIVGPMDRSGRFTYWPVRVQRGGEVLAPDAPEVPTELIDVRDLAEFIIHCAENETSGTFNATSPPLELTMGELLETCRRVAGAEASFTWVDREFLAAHEVQPWTDMPVWVPLDGEDAGHPFVRVDRALAAGLKYRPISETVRDTLDWWATLGADDRERFGRMGLKPERETELLAAWHKEKG